MGARAGMALAALLAAATTALALGATGGEAKKKRRSCAVSGSSTVTDNGQVRVFRRDVGRRRIETIYACRHSDGVRFRLGVDDGRVEQYVQPLRTAGRYVAWASTFCERDGVQCDAEVGVLDTRRRRRTAYQAAEGGPGRVEALVVRENGSVAWTSMTDQNASLTEVWAGDGAGLRRLDLGKAIDPEELALGLTQVYWLRGGAPQTAPLG